MQILDLSEFRKLVLNVFLCRFFVDISDQNNPTLYGCSQNICEHGYVIKN